MIGAIEDKEILHNDIINFYFDIITNCLKNRRKDDYYTWRYVLIELVNLQYALHYISIEFQKKIPNISEEKLEFNIKETHKMFKYYLDIIFDVESDDCSNSESEDLRKMIVSILSDKKLN